MVCFLSIISLIWSYAILRVVPTKSIDEFIALFVYSYYSIITDKELMWFGPYGMWQKNHIRMRYSTHYKIIRDNSLPWEWVFGVLICHEVANKNTSM